MTYTIQAAQEDFARLLKEAEDGNEVVIARDGKPVARLAAVETESAPRLKRIPGQFAGLPQSLELGVPIVSRDTIFDQYRVTRIW
jgi:prevent-host-death family protein